ncbi:MULTISPECIES: hypothetical protein [Brachyspira]|nr:hypothetical protein [Brachyspira hyodysenteriae]MCZ9966426.1 hypothetical protein [Brachyspira hyodysenteriae]MDA0077909.1 hypothetical protein [Brachyspira hyodysenteriae]WPC23189.1 hypothetical protein N4239_09585 [Brachyspira hyodysenteriae]WPC24417.1 hypothetical protein N4239_01155 [Brachyspira hyodysenteriae]WPC25175.1 hypothetical protein N4239_05070 [Brachyspira hyodysenteriae]
MKIDSQKQYIHIERDNKEERIIIDAKNISSEDTIYLLTEFIYFVTNKENVPADGFIDIIKEAVRLKTELEKRNE